MNSRAELYVLNKVEAQFDTGNSRGTLIDHTCQSNWTLDPEKFNLRDNIKVRLKNWW